MSVNIAITENKDDVLVNVTGEDNINVAVTENKDEVSVFVDSAVTIQADKFGFAGAELTPDNTKLTVFLTDEGYNTALASGALEVTDFAVSISGGTATSPVLSNIRDVYDAALGGGEVGIKFNLAVTGTPDGTEVLTVNPVADSVYNAAGAAMATAESETVTLNSATSVNAQIVIDRIETVSGELLTATEKTAITNFVDAGFWDVITEFYFYRLGSEAKSKVGWKAKSITPVNAPTWSTAGYPLNGSSQYLDLNFNPAVDTFDINNHTIASGVGAYTTVDAGEGLIGASDGASADIEIRDIGPTSDLFFSGGKADALSSTAHYAGDFLANSRYYGQKSSSSNQKIYENTTLKNENTTATTATKPNKNFFSGAVNTSSGTQNYFNGGKTFDVIATGALNIAAFDAAYVQLLTDLGL